MDNDTNYQLSLVKRLSFTRYGGTAEELQAANILMDEIENAGGHGEFMEFNVPVSHVQECSVRAGALNVDVVPYGLSGNVSGDLLFYYAERGTEEDYRDIESLNGYIVLLDKMSYDAYKILRKKGASAFMVISGKYWETDITADMFPRNLKSACRDIGVIPGFLIRARDALTLVRDGVKSLTVRLSQTDSENVSRNVLAVIPGTEKPDESIVITAHYDSVPVGTGSWDNASGASNVMALYRRFIKNPAKRTLRFIWCGCEEQGLLGSRAYVKTHRELIENEIRFCFNFDMCGTALGNNNIFVTGGDDLIALADQFAKERGWRAEIIQKVHPSDSAPFADNGIPCLGITRRTAAAEIHTRHDLGEALCAKEFNSIERFSGDFIERVANSAVIPVGRGMPDNMRQALDKFFQKSKKETT